MVSFSTLGMHLGVGCLVQCQREKGQEMDICRELLFNFNKQF